MNQPTLPAVVLAEKHSNWPFLSRFAIFLVGIALLLEGQLAIGGLLIAAGVIVLGIWAGTVLKENESLLGSLTQAELVSMIGRDAQTRRSTDSIVRVFGPALSHLAQLRLIQYQQEYPMKLFVDEAGNTHEAAYLDGYRIADRLLESVMIKIEVDDKDQVKASFLEEDCGYVSNLNEANLLEQTVSYVQGMIKRGDLSELCPSPYDTDSYDMIVEVVDGPAPVPSRPTP